MKEKELILNFIETLNKEGFSIIRDQNHSQLNDIDLKYQIDNFLNPKS